MSRRHLSRPEGRALNPNMVLLMCVLWAVCAGALRGQSRGQSRGPVHHLPLFKHAPGPLVAREMFRPVPHKSPLPHGLASLLIPGPEQQQQQQQPGHTQATPLGLDVWCGLWQISVRVDRLRLRHWSSPAQFRLGSCPVSAASPRYLYFHRGLSECGRDAQVVGGQLVYKYSLYYVTPHQGSVLRVPPLNLPLSCHYNRFHYSYRVGYQPLARPTSFLKSVQSRASFSLRVCNSQWEVLSPEHEVILGEPVYFVAQTGTLLAGERLYVDSCHVSSSKDPSSSPRVDIISNHGCMTDSVRADSGSHFVSWGPSELRFSVDSLLFTTAAQVLFLHCSMSVGLQPSASSKSCTYNRATGRWQELDTSSSACSCCDSVCGAPEDPVSTFVSSAAWHLAQQQTDRHQVSVKSGGPGLRDDQHQVSVKTGGPGLRDDQHQVSVTTGGLGLGEDQHQVSMKSGGPGLREDQHQVSMKTGGPGLREDQHQPWVSLKSGGPGLRDDQHQVSVKTGGPGLREDQHQVSMKTGGPGLREDQHQVSVKTGGPGLREDQHQVSIKTGGPGLREDQHQVSVKTGGPGLREDQHQVSVKTGGPGLRDDQHQVSMKTGGPGLRDDQHQVSVKTGGPGLRDDQHQVSVKTGGPGLRDDQHQVSVKSEGPGLTEGQFHGAGSLNNGGQGLMEFADREQADMQRDSQKQDGTMETRPPHSSSLYKSVLTNQTSAQNQKVGTKSVNTSRLAALDYMD
ncbi:uncharacterized protein [Eucyclogobius newberryi]|uniref:uncharacterized protein n=1 Tax=Eucyclogobius newberryi TaxID=166745 RepID=UPI003B59DDF9